MSIINQIVKNDTTYDIRDSRVDTMTGIFEAEYGVTTYNEVSSKYNEGWTIIVNYDNAQYELVYHSTGSFKFNAIKSDSGLTQFVYECITLSAANGWSINSEQLQRSLTAGDNIQINGNVISATGGGSSVDVDGKTIITGEDGKICIPEGGSGWTELVQHEEVNFSTTVPFTYTGSDFYNNDDFNALKSVIDGIPEGDMFTFTLEYVLDGNTVSKVFTMQSPAWTETGWNTNNESWAESYDEETETSVSALVSLRYDFGTPRIHIWFPYIAPTAVNSLSSHIDAYEENVDHKIVVAYLPEDRLVPQVLQSEGNYYFVASVDNVGNESFSYLPRHYHYSAYTQSGDGEDFYASFTNNTDNGDFFEYLTGSGFSSNFLYPCSNGKGLYGKDEDGAHYIVKVKYDGTEAAYSTDDVVITAVSE